MLVIQHCTKIHELSIYGDGSTMVSKEPQRQKIYLRKCVPSEDSDQTARSRSLIRIFAGRILDSQGRKVSSCKDPTVRIVGRTSQKVRFITLQF